MKDEIKEILDEMIDNEKLINVENDYERIIFEYLANNCSEFDDEHIKQLVNLKVEQYKQLLDYITNLQESEAYYYGQYKDYKSRNEKAIEYINSDTHLEGWINIEHYGEREQDLLNILQGSDEE